MTSLKTTGAAPKRSMFDLSDDGGSDSDADDALLLAAEAAERDQPVDDRLQPRPPVTEDTSPNEKPKMTSDQAARAEKNRLKAVALKKARLASKEIRAPDHITGENGPSSSQGNEAKKKAEVVDSGAGFFIDEEEEEGLASQAVEKPAPIIEPDRPTCLECSEQFGESYLLTSFDHEVCDKCKDTSRDGKHELITKTDAVKEFLLKDFDFDRREPPLKFITRKNPHNQRWGVMKLYLRVQVEERALEVWETPEALEAAHDEKDERREKIKSKKFMKKIKALRMQVRGSLYTKKDFAAEHVHEFGPEEVVDEENDEYCKTCTSCGYVNTYEKM